MSNAAFCNPVMLLPCQFLVSCFFLCRAANTITANPVTFCSMLTCAAQHVSNLVIRAPVCELQRFERATEQECCRPSCSDSCPARPNCSGSGPERGCRPHCSGSGPARVAGPVVQVQAQASFCRVQARKGLQAQMFRFRPGQGLQAQLFRFRPGKGLQAQLFSFRSGKGCRPSCSGSGPERVAGRKGLQSLCCRLRRRTGCRLRFAGSGPERVAGPVVQVQARKGLQAQFCRFRPGKGRRPSKTRPATQTLLISNKRIFSFFKIVEAFGLQGSFLRPGKRLQAPLCRFRP